MAIEISMSKSKKEENPFFMCHVNSFRQHMKIYEESHKKYWALN